MVGPLALVVGVVGLLLWAIGGYYAADYAVGSGYRWLYWIGLILLVLYFPLNWWRRLEDRTGGGEAPVTVGSRRFRVGDAVPQAPVGRAALRSV